MSLTARWSTKSLERKHLWRFHLDVAESRVPLQRGRNKIQPAGAPCRPKLAKSLRDTDCALHNELLQGRACCVLLFLMPRCRHSGFQRPRWSWRWHLRSIDNLLAPRRSGKLLCKGTPPKPNLFLTSVRWRPVRRDKQSSPAQQGYRDREAPGIL